jgi:hypothetical protein
VSYDFSSALWKSDFYSWGEWGEECQDLSLPALQCLPASLFGMVVGPDPNFAQFVCTREKGRLAYEKPAFNPNEKLFFASQNGFNY